MVPLRRLVEAHMLLNSGGAIEVSTAMVETAETFGAWKTC